MIVSPQLSVKPKFMFLLGLVFGMVIGILLSEARIIVES